MNTTHLLLIFSAILASSTSSSSSSSAVLVESATNEESAAAAAPVSAGRELQSIPTHYSAVRRKPLDRSKLKYIEIGGLFPMNGTTGWIGGQGCLPAAMMALEDVNNNEEILKGYYLNLTWNNSQCDPGLGTAILYDLIYTPPNKTLILGGCSIVCTTIAETAKMYNLIVVGYGSSSPALSDRTRFPTFFRTHPSATIHNPTRIELFQKFKWTRIAIILEAEELFVTTGADLEKKCKAAGIDVLTRISFLGDPSEAVKSLHRTDARIIVAMAYGGAARKMMCSAYWQKLYGKQHVWFLIGWYEDNWFHPAPDAGINCTMDQMMQVVEKHITTEALVLNQGPQDTVAGMTAQQWLVEYETRQLPRYAEWLPPGGKPQEGFQEAPLAYDAIWAVAFALNKTIEKLSKFNKSLDGFNYESHAITEIIKEELMNVSFRGVSGTVAFDEAGDRISWTQIEQMINGKYIQLGFYDTDSKNLTWNEVEQWVGGRPPRDRTEIVPTLVTVSRPLFLALSTCSCVGIVAAFGLLIFNYRCRANRYIQMSHPSSNNLMLLGAVFCLISVVLFGLDGQDVGIEYFEVICNSRAFFISVGFSLFFGAMFAKTWICHVLHTQNKRKINNNQIYLIIFIFTVLDVIILVIWYLKDPMRRHIEVLPVPVNADTGEQSIATSMTTPTTTTTTASSTSTSDDDVFLEDVRFQPQLERCESSASLVWYGVFFCYKGLVLLFGLFLSYETRSVKMKQLNDSRLVGMSIYNVVILCLITGPVSLVINNQVNSHFAFVALTIIFCCFLSMALIFIPKIIEVVRHQQNLGSGLNGTFHETMSCKEEEERFVRLTSENEELKMKIAEKERQIDEVKKKIDVMSKEQLERRRAEEREAKMAAAAAAAAAASASGIATSTASTAAAPVTKTILKKAVRIQEPVEEMVMICKGGGGGGGHPSEMPEISASDSGFASRGGNSSASRPSAEGEFSESYL